MNLFLAADHAGFILKEKIKDYLQKEGVPYCDLGTRSTDAVNWVEYGAEAAQRVSADPQGSRAILVCGSGIGMAIVANKFKNVRAAVCWNAYSAEMSRLHNDANVLTLGARSTDEETALTIVQIFLRTPFAGGRHQSRLDYLREAVEEHNFN